MSLTIADVLGAPGTDPVPLATVTKVNANGTVDLSLEVGTAEQVSVLEFYTPRTGDTVFVLRRGQRLLVLGGARTSNDTTVDVSKAITIAWDVAPAPSGGVANPLVLPALATRSARGNDWERDEIFQGAYVPQYGYWRGLFFYGNGPAALRGRRVTRIRIDLHRRDEGGDNASRPVYLAGHIHPSRPSSAPVLTTSAQVVGSLARPGSGTSAATFDLPVAWGQALVDGTLKGFGTKYDGTTNYMILASLEQVSTQGRLTIDWA